MKMSVFRQDQDQSTIRWHGKGKYFGAKIAKISSSCQNQKKIFSLAQETFAHFAQKRNDIHRGASHLKSYRLKIEQWGNNRPIGGNITFCKIFFFGSSKVFLLFSTPWGRGVPVDQNIYLWRNILVFVCFFVNLFVVTLICFAAFGRISLSRDFHNFVSQGLAHDHLDDSIEPPPTPLPHWL